MNMFRGFTIPFFLYVCLSLSFGLGADTNQGAGRVYLKPKLVTSKTEVRASEILNWKSAWNPVLYSNLKSPLIVEPDEVSAKLSELAKKENQSQTDWDVRGTSSTIIPLTEEWDGKEIESYLVSYLEKEADLDRSRFRFQYQGENLSLPVTGVELQWRKVGKNLHGGKRLFPLDLFHNGKLIHSVSLGFVIDEKKEAWFTKHHIESKHIITSEDVEKRSFFTSDNTKDYDLNSPVGKTALNAILESTPIEKKQLRLLHTVERGGEVQLVYTVGNIMIKAKTRALESGNEGDEISLMNVTSNKVLKGKIQSPGICLLEEGR